MYDEPSRSMELKFRWCLDACATLDEYINVNIICIYIYTELND